MHSKTILMLSHSFAPNTGGVETHLTDLTQYLSVNQIPCFVLTYQPLITKAKGKFLERMGSVTVCRLPWIGFGLFNILERFPLLQFLYLFPVLFVASFFVTLINCRKITAIHCHGMVCAVMGRVLKSIFRKKTIVSIHAVYGWLYNLKGAGALPSFLKWVLSGCDSILSLAEKSRKELIDMGIPENKARIFTYWVNQELFRPMDRDDSRKNIQIDEKFTVLFVGRLIKVKGVETLMEVAINLKDIQFVFAGDGPLTPTLKSIAKQHSNIRMLGSVDNSKLPCCYNAADILCVPSQYEEGFGRIILEALSCGCPVIGSRRGGIPEAMDESVGLLIEPDKDSIQASILSLRSDVNRLERLRAHCRKFAINRYSQENARMITEEYYS